ncbi:MAG: penicillin-binding protein 1A [Alphaproteobacteria bacterium]|nr:penicillin-binding protein 1A [Alphaproteobacteria bacterium]MCD8570954.1 penicillin-binding protein 1A [Alphaproteobacteria bacterium]
MKYLWYAFLGLFSLGFLGAIAGGVGGVFLLDHYSKDLPEYTQLRDYKPPVLTRLYAGDGRLLAEYATEKRVFVPIEFIPDLVKNAFIAAEDQNFYEHGGIDYTAIGRAGVIYAQHLMGRNVDVIGGSTITQQVVKNFLLTNERSFERKIKEAILATRMEQALPKDRILELYLNEIYLGAGTYGVGAASLYYFNKSLDELTAEEAAYLAALPKAPNNYHPIRKKDRAVARRNWVLGRMAEDGFITDAQATLAKMADLEVVNRAEFNVVDAPYFAEEVRRELAQQYKSEGLYEGGLAVRSSIDPHLQSIAVTALRNGLEAYDRRHGWRGAPLKMDDLDDWRARLNNMAQPENMLPSWDLAVVLDVKANKAELGFGDKPKGEITLDGVKWARACVHECYGLGPEITAVDQVLKRGDVVMVQELAPEEGAKENALRHYELKQVPLVQGAIIALDPHTGRVLAMQGGWQYNSSEFNRATQAQRQPGSAFKPFVYLAALDHGFTPATLVLDAPFVLEHIPGQFWRPTNYSGEYYGPTPIRVGVEKSKNLMTVRLADHLGMPMISEYAKRFGINDDMPLFLSFSLGASETTLLKLTNAYAMLVNGGKEITPTFIDRIQDRRGKTIFKHDNRTCPDCGDLIRWQGQFTPDIPDTRSQIQDPRTAYQMVSILEGVVQRGTGRSIAELGYPLAGKTGTTNESKDNWFVGFSPDLAVGVFVGFDDPRSLGKRETGASSAAPVFKEFMKEALKDTPPHSLPYPARHKTGHDQCRYRRPCSPRR